jgi:hypothetical protein
MTAVANAIFTAAQFNTYVRDNLLETSPAKATTAGSIFVTSGTNSISERIPGTATVATAETTASTTYAALTTAGPAVTVTTGTKALVCLKAGMGNTTSATTGYMGYDISGATTLAAADTRAVGVMTASTVVTLASIGHVGGAILQTGLTAGSNTFTAKYRAVAGTETFGDRDIVVIPF